MLTLEQFRGDKGIRRKHLIRFGRGERGNGS